jgi:hypothetical protein
MRQASFYSRRALALGSVAAAALALAGSASAASSGSPSLRFAPLHRMYSTSAVSSNWAGYALAAADTQQPTFTSVTSTWTQPKADCSDGGPSDSAFWIGLGGFNQDSQALEQIGTSADCTSAGQPNYYAWYEIVPAPPVNLKLKIVPGDTITTSVNVNGTSVLVQIKDRTRRTSVTKQLTVAAPDLTTAEVVAEAPSQCDNSGCNPLPLANFGSVTFTKFATTADGHAGTLTDPTWSAVAIQLVPGDPLEGSAAGAAPAQVSADGRSFSVAWQANATAPTSQG